MQMLNVHCCVVAVILTALCVFPEYLLSGLQVVTNLKCLHHKMAFLAEYLC